jgi:hypothetical protein
MESSVVIAPGIAGGANWSPSGYDPGRQLFYVGALHLPTRYVAREATRPDGSVLQYAGTQNTDEAWGTLTALDLGCGPTSAPRASTPHRSRTRSGAQGDMVVAFALPD